MELNRAVALAMLFGPAAGLEVVDALASEPALKAYHLLPSVRGDLLQKLGRLDEARSEFERAASLTRNERERKLLLDRAAGAVPPSSACGEPAAMKRIRFAQSSIAAYAWVQKSVRTAGARGESQTRWVIRMPIRPSLGSV